MGGAKQQSVLAYLLLHRNEPVLTERLVDELWRDEDPRRAAKALQMHVLGLRKVLDEGRLETAGRGYRLRVEPGELDLERAEALAEEAAKNDAEQAAALLRQALALFRGEPLGAIAYESFATAEAARLRELRLRLLEERIDADLGLGRHGALVAELEALLVEHPLRERLRAQLMLALYRSGRQADALDVYRRGRAVLVEALGLEPGSELRELEAQILRHDPALRQGSPPAGVVPSGRRRGRRSALLAAGGTAVVAAVATLVVLVTRTDRSPPVVVPNSLVRIDSRKNSVVDVTPVGHEPLAVVSSPAYLWVLNSADATVTRIDRSSGEMRTVGDLEAPTSIAIGDAGTLWVGSESAGHVVGLDAETMRLSARIDVPGPPPAFIAVSGQMLWASQPNVGDRRGRVSLLALDRGRVVRTFPLGGYTTEIAADDGTAWVGIGDSAVFAGISSSGSRVRRVATGPRPSGAALGFGSAWTASYDDGTVWRVNLSTARVDSVIHVGDGPWALAAGRDSIWVTNQRSGTVSRIDPLRNTVVATIELGFTPQGVVVDGDDVWVTVATIDARI